MTTRRQTCSGNECNATVTIDMRRHYADPECETNGSECPRCGMWFCENCFPRHWHCHFCGDELPPCDAEHECATCRDGHGKPTLTARAIVAMPTQITIGSVLFQARKPKL